MSIKRPRNHFVRQRFHREGLFDFHSPLGPPELHVASYVWRIYYLIRSSNRVMYMIIHLCIYLYWWPALGWPNILVYIFIYPMAPTVQFKSAAQFKSTIQSISTTQTNRHFNWVASSIFPQLASRCVCEGAPRNSSIWRFGSPRIGFWL